MQEKISIAAECDPPVPQAKRLKLTGEVVQRDTAGGGASSPQIELGNEDSGEVKQSQSPSIQVCM